jgi:hypothetical protein
MRGFPRCRPNRPTEKERQTPPVDQRATTPLWAPVAGMKAYTQSDSHSARHDLPDLVDDQWQPERHF